MAEASSGNTWYFVASTQKRSCSSLIGIGGRQVIVLRPVLGQVEQFPVYTVDDVRGRWRRTILGFPIGHRARHPAIVIDGSIAEHLEYWVERFDGASAFALSKV